MSDAGLPDVGVMLDVGLDGPEDIDDVGVEANTGQDAGTDEDAGISDDAGINPDVASADDIEVGVDASISTDFEVDMMVGSLVDADLPWSGSFSNPQQSATLEVDDTDGLGPERISLTELEDTDVYNGRPYRAAVHYFNDGSDGLISMGYGPSTATVRVILRDIGVFEFSRVMNKWDIWEVAAIFGREEGAVVEAIEGELQELRPPGL